MIQEDINGEWSFLMHPLIQALLNTVQGIDASRELYAAFETISLDVDNKSKCEYEQIIQENNFDVISNTPTGQYTLLLLLQEINRKHFMIILSTLLKESLENNELQETSIPSVREVIFKFAPEITDVDLNKNFACIQQILMELTHTSLVITTPKRGKEPAKEQEFETRTQYCQAHIQRVDGYTQEPLKSCKTELSLFQLKKQTLLPQSLLAMTFELECCVKEALEAMHTRDSKKILQEHFTQQVEGFSGKGLSIFLEPNLNNPQISSLLANNKIKHACDTYRHLRGLKEKLPGDDKTTNNQFREFATEFEQHHSYFIKYTAGKTIDGILTNIKTDQIKPSVDSSIKNSLRVSDSEHHTYNQQMKELINSWNDNQVNLYNNPRNLLIDVLKQVNNLAGTHEEVTAATIQNPNFRLTASKSIDSKTLAILNEILLELIQIDEKNKMAKPDYSDNINNLGNLAIKVNELPTRNSSLKKLSNALFVLAAFLIIVGVIAAIPSAGASLALSAAVATAISLAAFPAAAAAVATGGACRFFAKNQKEKLVSSLVNASKSLDTPTPSSTSESKV